MIEKASTKPTVDIENASVENYVSDSDNPSKNQLDIKEEQLHVKEPIIPKRITESAIIRWSRKHFTTLFHIFLGCFFTSYWLSLLIQDDKRHMWLVRTIFYIMIMVRLITWHSPVLHIAFQHVARLWNYIVEDILYRLIPNPNARLLAATLVTVAVFLVGTFVPEETPDSKREDRAIAFLGVLVAIFALWLTSNDRSKVVWHTVIGGMLMQFIVAIFVLRTKAGYDIFDFLSTLARELLGFAKDGVAFLTTPDIAANNTYFFFSVLPGVIFFVAFMSVWFHYGLIQWVVQKFSLFFFWTLKVSGAESVVAAASPFIGMGESAILIKTLMPYLTDAEIHQVMTSGFSTIAGGVLVAYIGMGLNAQALISSCVMSIPASLAVSKLRYPESEKSVSAGNIEVPMDEGSEEEQASTAIEAFVKGSFLGLRIAGYILTSCLCIIALVALIDGVLTYFGKVWNIENLTLELMGSYILYPVAFLLGTPRNEILAVSRLLAIKLTQNEFNGYLALVNDYPDMSKRGQMIATYALCGFANFGSCGSQLGVLGALAPNKSRAITRLILSSLIAGTISTLLSAAIAAMVVHDLTKFQTSLNI